ncbi:DUF4349 domain-containing protein [Ruminococcus sp.]|uniref:DUF4349 domain-containing protein n=1 Tax=Ruminococcus sp. TaxID=41978 RepID=UPI0025FABCEC|nr:DUF4349 domain-containing protein [Ruminococcus sp.]MCR4639888.1 DUF4349 domain-containing protein [Ruminococcus sp.]
MKKALLAAALASTLMLTACGSAYKNTMSAADKAPRNAEAGEFKKNNDSIELETNAPSEVENPELTNIDYKQSDVKVIDTQMLVYSCDMSIDVLDFDKAVDQVHDYIKSYSGFIENENYSDGGNTSQWLYSDEQKWKNFNAVIRVPSAKYDEFCESVESVGDMRRKNASVDNLTTEYSDLKTTLTIYEAKEDRYLEMLKEIKDQKQAVSVEEELTNIQVEIARIKTRMNSIENDVAYSYVNLTLNEVRKYSEKPVVKKTDTFGQRLSNTLSNTWSTFLNFLEGALFVIIRVLPYLLLFGILAFIIVKIVKIIIKANEKSKKKRYEEMVKSGKINNKPVFPNGNPMPMQVNPPYPVPPAPMPNNQPIQGGAQAPDQPVKPNTTPPANTPDNDDSKK